MAPKVQVKVDEAKAKSVHQRCRGYLVSIHTSKEERWRKSLGSGLKSINTYSHAMKTVTTSTPTHNRPGMLGKRV